MKIHTRDEGYNQQIEVQDRKMILSSTALGILRHQLARNIGIDRIKGFLVRFGWEMGEDAAKRALESRYFIRNFNQARANCSYEPGHISGYTRECTVEFDEKHNIVSLWEKELGLIPMRQ